MLQRAPPHAAPPRPLTRLPSSRPSYARSCTLAPSAAEESDYSLYCAAGDGLKHLRAALLLTREWNTARERDAAAAALEAEGDASGCACALRAKLASKLSKSNLLLLCRHWGYRSQFWCRKVDMRRKRPRAGAGPDATARPPPPPPAAVAASDGCAVAAALALLPRARLPSTGAVAAPAVAVLLDGPLAAQLARSSAAFAGPRACQVVLQLRHAPFPRSSLQFYLHCAACGRGLAARCRAALAAPRVWLAAEKARTTDAFDHNTIDDDTDTDTDTRPAWESLLHSVAEAPAEEMLRNAHALIAKANRYHALVTEGRAGVSAAPPVARSTMNNKLVGAMRDVAGAVTAGALLLAQLRAAASLAAYGAAGELLLAHLARYMDDAADAYAERAAWGARALSDGVAAAEDAPSDAFLSVFVSNFQAVASAPQNHHAGAEPADELVAEGHSGSHVPVPGASA
jgi:hypothetical protein